MGPLLSGLRTIDPRTMGLLVSDMNTMGLMISDMNTMGLLISDPATMGLSVSDFNTIAHNGLTPGERARRGGGSGGGGCGAAAAGTTIAPLPQWASSYTRRSAARVERAQRRLVVIGSVSVCGRYNPPFNAIYCRHRHRSMDTMTIPGMCSDMMNNKFIIANIPARCHVEMIAFYSATVSRCCKKVST